MWEHAAYLVLEVLNSTEDWCMAVGRSFMPLCGAHKLLLSGVVHVSCVQCIFFCTCCTVVCIPYSGKLSREKTFANWWKYNFRGENFHRLLAFAMPKDATLLISRRKLSQIGEKYNFRGENFHRLLAFATPKDATLLISRRKLSQIATKLQNSRKFSPLKVSRSTVGCRRSNMLLPSCVCMQIIYRTVYFW